MRPGSGLDAENPQISQIKIEKGIDVKARVVQMPSKCDIRIDEGSDWENPFKIGIHHKTTEEATLEYKKWILGERGLLERLGELKGKTLGCGCGDKHCHGEVLAELAESEILFLVKLAGSGLHGPFQKKVFVDNKEQFIKAGFDYELLMKSCEKYRSHEQNDIDYDLVIDDYIWEKWLGEIMGEFPD